MAYNAGDIVERAIDNRNSTKTIDPQEYYPEDTDIDVDCEISRISCEPKTSDNIHRLENLKRIRTIRRWFGKWFENSARKDCRQFVMHTNWKFYWPWHPETVIVDTVFVDFYKDGRVETKQFEECLFLIDNAETNYTEVTGRNTLKKLERILDSDTIDTYKQ